MTDTMKALVYSKPEDFAINEVPIPDIAPNQILLKVKACGICKTDEHIHKGHFISKFPLIPGHEFAGVIEKMGSDVKGLKIGDRVTCDNTVLCGTCSWCKKDKPLFCENFYSMGVTGPGGFAEYAAVNFDKCFKISDSLSFDEASFAEPAACSIHGMDTIDVTFGDEVILFGSGPTGMILAQLLKYGGASKMVVAAPKKFKLDALNKMGIADTVQIERDDWKANDKKIKGAYPEGFDIVVDATGASSVIQEALKFTKRGAKLVIYGVCDESETITVSPYEIFEKELKIIGSFCQTHCFDRAVKYLEEGIVKVAPMITHSFSLDDYAKGLEIVMSGKDNVKVMINP